MTSRLVLLTLAVLAPLASSTVADTIAFREGETNAFATEVYAGTGDTTLLSNNDTNRNANFGAYDKVLVGIHDRLRRGLLRFDLSSMQGKYVSIEGATLTLTIDQSTHAGTFNIYQLVDENAGWAEGAGGAGGTVAPATSGEATWNNLAHPSIGWTGGAGIGAGGHVATPVASVGFLQQAAGTPTLATLEIALPASLIESWITGTNAGLLLKHASEGVVAERQLLQLRSGESATPSSRPTLTIDFTPIPEPASATLALLGLALATSRHSRP